MPWEENFVLPGDSVLLENGYEIVPKKWGREIIITNNNLYCGKILEILPGHISSIHNHKLKDETFMAVKGVVCVTAWRLSTDEEKLVRSYILRGWAKDSIRLEPGTLHSFEALEEPAVVIEFSTPHSDEDVYRLRPSE